MVEQIWEIGRAMFLFLSFWGYIFVAVRFGKIKGWFAPIVCMSGIALILFWAGLFNCLTVAADLILTGGIAGFSIFLILCIQGKTGHLKWNPAEFCFGVGAAAFILLSLNLRLIHYDNFSHWAVIVKYLLSAGKLPGADITLIPFRDYPPGSSMFIYYVCRYAGHSQGMMLLAQNSMILACFLAVFGIVKEKRRFLLYSFLGMGCSVLSYLNLTIRMNNLLVDFLLPLLTMASVAVSYRCRTDRRKFCIMQITLLGFTAIVKSTGGFFAGVAGVYALWELFRSEKRSERIKEKTGGKLFCAATIICGAVLPPLAWQYHLDTQLAGFKGKFEGGFHVGRELYGQVTENFLKTALDLSGRAAQMFFLCIVLAAAAILYARFKLRKRWRLELILPAGIVMTVLYYAGMLYMYLHSMPEEEAVRLAGFERYACSVIVLFAGVLIMGATVDLEHSFAVDIDMRGAYRAFSSPGAKRRYQYAVLGTVILGANFLYSEFNGLRSIQETYETSLPGQAEQIMGDRWYENGVPDKGKYLVIASDEDGQVSSGEVRYVCRYLLWAPDVEVTDRLSESELAEAGKKYDHIFILDETSPSGSR